jgi:pyruvate dehydrogenase E2 component (dihydrolipoamide acetyltransferase)
MKQLTMPQLALGAEDVVLLAWLVEVGAPFATGDPIAEVDTDKAAMEVEASFDGVLLARLAGEGDVVAVGAVYGHAAEAGEDLDEARRALQALGNGAPPAIAKAVERNERAPAARPAEPGAARSASAKVAFLVVSDGEVAGLPIEPMTRVPPRQASSTTEATIDPGERALAGPASEQPLGRIRRAIARRMVPAAAVPTFTVTREIPVEAAEAAVADARAAGIRATLTDVLLAAAAAGVRAVPAANAWLDNATLVSFEHVGIALAVDTATGVSAPVLRDLGNLDLAEIAALRGRLVEQARAGALAPHDLAGATITLSNVAGLGAHSITPVLTVPQVAAIGVGGASGHGEGRTVTVSVVGDHRALDGADGARFLAAFAEVVQQPPWQRGK